MMDDKQRGEYPMNGGDDLYSYSNNSKLQKGAVVGAKELISKAIAEKLETRVISNSSSSNTFRIADLGCSAGPNTLLAVQNVIESLESKYKLEHSQGLVPKMPEFEVLFNDHTSNDFNTLFKSLPLERTYFAAGVPGSFYGRIFPEASLHFVHSSYAIHWLSRVPEEVLDRDSPAWNKGRISFELEREDEVARAFASQFEKDMETFLNARAQEIVSGGLMVLIFPGRHRSAGSRDIAHKNQNDHFTLLGTCLMDMAKKGIISEDKVDDFNIPIYEAYPEELESIVLRNGQFSIEMIDEIHDDPAKSDDEPLYENAQQLASTMRAILEGLIKEHFGDQNIVDELFDLFAERIEENPELMKPDSTKDVSFIFVLKRKSAMYLQ